MTQTGRNSTPPRASVAGSLQSEKLEMAAQKEVAAQFFSGQALLARWLSSSKPIVYCSYFDKRSSGSVY
jgi:hypothetical protein